MVIFATPPKPESIEDTRIEAPGQIVSRLSYAAPMWYFSNSALFAAGRLKS